MTESDGKGHFLSLSVTFRHLFSFLTDSGGPSLHPWTTVTARLSASIVCFRHLSPSRPVSMGKSLPFQAGLHAFLLFFQKSKSSVDLHCVSK